MAKFFDAHSHILIADERRLKQMQADGLVGLVYNGIDIKTSRQGLETAKKFPGYVLPTLGIQPEILVPGSDLYDENYGIDEIKSDISELKSLYEEGSDLFRAIGEVGLDYHWLNQLKTKNLPPKADQPMAEKLKTEKSKRLQKLLFINQIKLAVEWKLPLVIHPRGAEEECLQILNSKPAALFHSYTGSLETAKDILKAGYYMSFNGILTFKSAENIREIFLWAWKHFPEQILSETDSPFLAPEPMRGKENNPEYVRYVVEYMAELIDAPLEGVASTIIQNSYRFYDIDLSD